MKAVRVESPRFGKPIVARLLGGAVELLFHHSKDQRHLCPGSGCRLCPGVRDAKAFAPAIRKALPDEQADSVRIACREGDRQGIGFFIHFVIELTHRAVNVIDGYECRGLRVWLVRDGRERTSPVTMTILTEAGAEFELPPAFDVKPTVRHYLRFVGWPDYARQEQEANEDQRVIRLHKQA